MADNYIPSTDFQERQQELNLLSSFISEHEQWLNSILKRFEWSRESLHQENTQGGSFLVQCPFNEHHYVPHSSLEKHKAKCQYAVLGVDVDAVDELQVDGKILYKDSNVPSVDISPAIQQAVSKYSTEPQLDGSGPVVQSCDSHMIKEQFASLEDSLSAPNEITTWRPHQIISYIKSWHVVPSGFLSLPLSTTSSTLIKGWLFKHLPPKHAYRSTLGGEIAAVDSIMHSLTPSSEQGVTSLTPDTLMKKLRPLLGLNTRKFVLDLWKFVHISQLQTEHDIQDSVVEDIAPMPASLINRANNQQGEGVEHKEDNPAISEIIEAIALEEGASEPSLPIPMDHVFYNLTTTERRVTYDYAIEMTRCKTKSKTVVDPDLYRDDAAALKAKLKTQSLLPQDDPESREQDSMSYLEQLKRKRDYKRRRQSYRAKNVHITQRSTTEVFRAIINNRMEEITQTLREEQGDLAEDGASQEVEEDVGTRTHHKRDEGGDDRGGSPFNYRYDTRPMSPDHHHRRYQGRDYGRSSRYQYDSRREQGRERSRSRERKRERNESRTQAGHRLSPELSSKEHTKEGKESSKDLKKKKHRHHSHSTSRSRSRDREKRRYKKHKKHQSRSHSRDRHTKQRSRSRS